MLGSCIEKMMTMRLNWTLRSILSLLASASSTSPRGMRVCLVGPCSHAWILCKKVLHIEPCSNWKVAKSYVLMF